MTAAIAAEFRLRNRAPKLSTKDDRVRDGLLVNHIQ
jgi:hypothetical protein